MRRALIVSVVLSASVAWVFLGRLAGDDESEYVSSRAGYSESVEQSGTEAVDVPRQFTASARAPQVIQNEEVPSPTNVADSSEQSFLEFRAVTVNALPNLAGFPIELLLPAQEFPYVHAAQRLSDEREDPIWAAEVEGKIWAAIQEPLGTIVSLIEVECRTTLCGVVVALPENGAANLSNEIEARMRESFDLLGTSSVDVSRRDGSFAAFYFTLAR